MAPVNEGDSVEAIRLDDAQYTEDFPANGETNIGDGPPNNALHRTGRGPSAGVGPQIWDTWAAWVE